MAGNEKRKYLIKRLVIYFLGMIVMAFGIAMTIRANIGVAPGGVISVALYMFIPLTVGQCAAIFNVFCVVMQIVISRKPNIGHLLQLPFAFVFGLLLDLFYDAMLLPINTLWQGIFFLTLGMCILALGIRALVGANIILAPPDGLARAIGDVFNWPMSKAKLVFDIIAFIDKDLDFFSC
jgi:uncharacterized membrane protein YczE